METPSFLTQKNYKDLQQIDPKELKIRKKLCIYTAQNQENQKISIFFIQQKSRILQKEVALYEEIYAKVERFSTLVFDKKVIYIAAPLCSKAKEKLESVHWEVNTI